MCWSKTCLTANTTWLCIYRVWFRPHSEPFKTSNVPRLWPSSIKGRSNDGSKLLIHSLWVHVNQNTKLPCWLFLCLWAGDSCDRRHYVFKLSVRPSIRLILMNIISQELLDFWNYFKSGTSIHLDSRMNRLDFGGQKSTSLWPHICPIIVLKHSCGQRWFWF